MPGPRSHKWLLCRKSIFSSPLEPTTLEEMVYRIPSLCCQHPAKSPSGIRTNLVLKVMKNNLEAEGTGRGRDCQGASSFHLCFFNQYQVLYLLIKKLIKLAFAHCIYWLFIVSPGPVGWLSSACHFLLGVFHAITVRQQLELESHRGLKGLAVQDG